MEVNNFLKEFSGWINEKKPFDGFYKNINQRVFPNTSKIKKNISLDLGILDEVVKDFLKKGGKIIKEDGNVVLIEVNSGTFYINKKYIY
jgi:hypothetical protein